MTESGPGIVFGRHLHTAIGDFEKDRDRHKRRALALKLSTSALGAAATILLGWQNPGGLANTFKNAALILTSLVTLFAAYDAFFEPRKLWVRETFVLNSLRDLRRQWEIAVATGHAGPEQVVAFSDAFHAILTKSLNEWITGKQDAKS